MRLKSFLYIILFICLAFLLSSCADEGYSDAPSDGNNDESEIPSEQQEDINTPERIKIYKVTVSMRTDNLENTINSIKENLLADEWCDVERTTNTYAYFEIRVKSDRLEEFKKSLSGDGEILSYEQTATDISLTYYDTKDKITALQAERTRLLELYDSFSVPEIFQIETRITELEFEIGKLQQTINRYDSLVEYSTVYLTINGKAHVEPVPFGKKIINTFIDALNALFVFLKGLLIVIVAVLPFAVIIVPSGLGINYIVKKRKFKNQNKQ